MDVRLCSSIACAGGRPSSGWQQSPRLVVPSTASPASLWACEEGLRGGRLCGCRSQRRVWGIVRAGSASGAGYGGSQPIFPRISVRDPHKRLGVGKEASMEEVQEARTYLISLYGGHAESAKAIESAVDRILMDSLKQRKKGKPVQRKLVAPPAWMRTISNRIEVPARKKILYRAGIYSLLAVWSVFAKESRGPAFQVLLSFIACIYFLNDRLKKPWKAALLGVAVLLVGWLFSTLLWPILPTQFLPRSWGIELVSSLISYVFLFCGSTYLK
eukprot:TRINITY_DN19148_c0_g1_i1.p1 TRINITY_DN19148_c0_g1~~TRINITY_DN19148_c0_g1_i1.p1  ORF type:complete len:272 (-),score=24.26 TRINITY_DN19148_c0_g1_i1:237-1052(-)